MSTEEKEGSNWFNENILVALGGTAVTVTAEGAKNVGLATMAVEAVSVAFAAAPVMTITGVSSVAAVTVHQVGEYIREYKEHERYKVVHDMAEKTCLGGIKEVSSSSFSCFPYHDDEL